MCPRFREVLSVVSWVYCFLTYVSVRMVDEAIETVRDMLSYCCLIIWEAFWLGGEGWWEYDHTFQSQVAIDPAIPQQSIWPKLQATTLVGQHGATGQLGPHWAWDCVHTPEDSTYKHPTPKQNPTPPPALPGGCQANTQVT